jgi:hypothetical protein
MPLQQTFRANGTLVQAAFAVSGCLPAAFGRQIGLKCRACKQRRAAAFAAA